MSKLRCPLCGRSFMWSDAAVVAGRSKAVVDDPRGGGPLSVGGWRELVEGDREHMSDVLEAHGLLAALCPGGDQLPLDFGDSNPIYVGVVGSVAASKSTYLAGVHRVATTDGLGPLARGSSPRSLLDDDVLARASEQVYQRREVLPTTQSRGMRMLDLRLSTGETIRLTFVDIAGEALTDSTRAVQERYLDSLDAVLVIVDPLQLPGVRRIRRESSVEDVTTRVLRNVVGNLEARGRAMAQIDIPASVVVGKADEIVGYAEHRVADWLMLPECPDDFLLDVRAQESESAAVWAFLNEALDSLEFLDLVERFSNRSLHFATATDCAAEQGKYLRSPRPRRLAPPILRLLAANARLPQRLVNK